MLVPTVIPATLKPFIAAIMAISIIVPMANPPFNGPMKTCIISYKSLDIFDSENKYPIYIKIGSVMRGYQFSRVKLAWNGIATPPLPQRSNAKTEATPPITAYICRPVIRTASTVKNIKTAINS
jgi:hypothetical protein